MLSPTISQETPILGPSQGLRAESPSFRPLRTYPVGAAALDQAMVGVELQQECQQTPVLPDPGNPFSLSQTGRAGLIFRAG